MNFIPHFKLQRISRRVRTFILSAAALLCSAGCAFAAGFSFSGKFTTDSDTQSYFFTVQSAGTVVLSTSSYAAGGFDPSLAVFDSSGNLIASNRDGGCANVPANPTTGFCWDAYLSLNLPPGTYQAVLSQGANVASGPTLAAGFAYSGQGNFTRGPESTGTGGFWSSQGVQANSSFAVGVQGSDAAAAQLVISQSAPPGGQATIAYSQQLTNTGGTQPFSWSVISGSLPPGLTLSSGGLLSGTPAASGTYSFTVQVVDSSISPMTATQAYQMTIAAAPVYPPLTISGDSSLGDVAVGAAVGQSFFAAGGKPPYNWSSTSLPAGLSLSSAGALSGNASQPGNFTFMVQVSDAQGLSSSLSATLAVLGLAPVSLPTANTVSAYSASFTGLGGVPPYAFSGQGIPAGLALSGSGVLSGIAKKSGTFPITIQLADSGGASLSATFNLVVSAPATLTVSAAQLSTGTVSSPYSDTLGANGGAPPYNWTVIGGTLPPGLTAAASGTVSGTPTQAGTYTFTAQATDNSGATASGAVTITIAAPPLTVTSMSSLPNGILGSEYFGQIVTPAGGVAPYTFAISSGSLPQGLSLANGQIGGTPTSQGKFSFAITVTDSASPANTTSTSAQIVINPSQADLLISSASVPFSLTAGASALPGAASVPVRSSVVQQILNYSVQVSPAVSWLDIGGGNTTPGAVSLSLDPSALQLVASATPYQTNVVVTCTAPSPCAGNAQTISVSLIVSTPPAQLSITSSLLSFGLTSPGTLTGQQSFGIQNSGGGTLTIKSVAAADGWISISGAPTSLAAGPAAQATATVNATGLTPGFYRSSITVTSSAGTSTLPVTLLLAQNNSMSLAPSGTQFTAQQGGAPGNPTGSFSIPVTAAGAVNWTASVASGAPWLKLSTTSGSSTNASPGQVSYSIDPTAAAALSPQAYYGMIQVTSGDVYNSPQDFEVVLNVAPASDPAKPDPEPGGLVFISSNGALPPQTVQVYTSSTAATAYQVSASTNGGGNWLSVSPAMGTTSSTAAGSTAITASAAGLSPGVYTGGVSYAFSSAAVRTVNVTLIVPAGTGTPNPQIVPKAAPSCAPAKLVPTQTGLVSNFAQPVAWPTPLSIQLLDDCGNTVTNGQVVATFSNGDPPLALTGSNPTSGVYSATWTPRSAASQVVISAKASAAGLAPATATITGQVAPNNAPLLTPNATLHVFDPLVGGALSPGNIVQIYGAYLSAQTLLAPSIPLPTTLGGTSVIIGGIQVPLYFVSSGQINAQVPFELTAGKKYQILISANGALTTPDTIQLTDASPGIAAFASGQIIAQHLDGSLVSETAPAKPSEIIVFYLAGLGLTDNPVTSGAASPGTVLARPLDMPTVTINGNTVPILFGGLTPGLVGLYQINLAVPADAANGDMQLVVSQGGAQSNATILPVHQ